MENGIFILTFFQVLKYCNFSNLGLMKKFYADN